MPFICEDVYLKYFKKHINTKSITLCDWPNSENYLEEDLTNGELLKEIVGQVRKYKSQKAMSMKQELANVIISSPKSLHIDLKSELLYIMFIKKVNIIEGQDITILEE